MIGLELMKKAQKKFGIIIEMNVYFSPGRVNLIGEHIDYNGGNVLPCTLDIGTYGVASKREDDKVLCYSENFDNLGIISFSVNDLNFNPIDNWANYVKGVLKQMPVKKGFNLYVKGDIPNGSGLSSSASLELLVSIIANDLFNLQYSNLDLVKISHQAENEFIGVKCGIMDQFIIGMANNKTAILLNTSSMNYKYTNIDFLDYTLVIGNTNKKRTLAGSKYNERRTECERGLEILKPKYDIKYLCDLNLNEFNEAKYLIKEENILKRVRHVISENERTLLAYQALQNHDLSLFGSLLNQSHQSLKNDYEVTGFELDTLTSLFNEYHAIGARMTGAGFGGCMIALVKKTECESIIEKVRPLYQQITGLDASFYKVTIGSGAHKL